jgi:hypothetical protein
MILLRLIREIFGRGTPPALPPDEAGCDELMSDLWRRGKLMNTRERRRNQDLAFAVYDSAVASGLFPCDSQFDAAYRRALVATENRPYPLRRRLRFHNLYTLLGTVLRLEGAIAECGCFRGMSSRLLLDRLKTAEPGFTGSGYHVFDSFEGLSEPGANDAITGDNPEAARLSEMCQSGAFAASLETVRQGLAAFPAVEFHPGWIPQSFTGLPELKYRFVHLDLDLHDPTLAALEYFHPRMVKGGIVVCDDYSWPGARKAIESFCARHGVTLETTPHGQAVLRRDA